MRVRRPELAAQVERRLGERVSRLGGQIREIRRRRGWSQEDLAERAGLGRLVISRIERGQAALDLEALERIALALDVSLAVALGKDRSEDVADAGHLAIQELVLRTARAAGYRPGIEVPTKPAEPWRSADVHLERTPRQLRILVECWNTIGDFGAATRSTNRKLAELQALAVANWGAGGMAAAAWVVRATARNRDLVSRYPEAFGTRFPGSSRVWLRALTEGVDPPEEPGLVWCDAGATRLFEWRPG
jgi:transcriptional regulator with XRE-family HTH domain